MASVDGALKESVYKSRLNQTKKREAALLKFRHNISEFGIFGRKGGHCVPAGFNAWRESDGKLAIGQVTKMDIFHIEGIDMVMRGIDAPSGAFPSNTLINIIQLQ